MRSRDDGANGARADEPHPGFIRIGARQVEIPEDLRAARRGNPPRSRGSSRQLRLRGDRPGRDRRRAVCRAGRPRGAAGERGAGLRRVGLPPRGLPQGLVRRAPARAGARRPGVRRGDAAPLPRPAAADPPGVRADAHRRAFRAPAARRRRGGHRRGDRGACRSARRPPGFGPALHPPGARCARHRRRLPRGHVLLDRGLGEHGHPGVARAARARRSRCSATAGRCMGSRG